MNTSTTDRIRGLSEEEFAQEYGASRFSCNVLANRNRYVAEHIATNLVYKAFSPIISLNMDFVGAVIGPPELDYPLVGMNRGNFIFLGSLSTGVRNTVEEYGVDRLEPGDLLVCNDPFRVGNHVNDTCFIRPVFHEKRIVAFVVIRAHLLDIGGIIPGGFSLLKLNVFENGLVLPPMRMFHREEPVKETIRLVLDNSRFGETILPDFFTIQASCALGERLILESVRRHGTEAYLGAMRYSLDSSAEAMRRALLLLPDGEYEGEDILDTDGLDADEEYRFHVTVIKKGARVEVDCSGSSRQARTSLNGTPLDAQTIAALGLKVLLDPETPFTSGAYRDIDVVVPPGSVTSARPDASTMFYWEVQSALLNAMMRALAEPLGSRAVGGAYGSTNLHTGEGRNPDGTPWFTAAELEAQFGGWGATDAGDADSHSGMFTLNQRVTPTEEIERRVPVLLMSKEYLADTGGPGTHRGGAALRKDSLFLSDGDHYLVPLHFRHPSGNGVHGGADGRVGGGWFFENPDVSVPESAYRIPEASDTAGATVVSGVVDEEGRLDAEGEFAFFGRRPVWTENRGSTLRWVTNGGGGWGDPFARELDAVLRDVRDGYVSPEGALRDYGVVVAGDPHEDPEGLRIDVAATARARARS
jgi:N-methylhydantoinase B